MRKKFVLAVSFCIAFALNTLAAAENLTSEDLYWGENIEAIQKTHELTYKYHYDKENAPAYAMKLKSNSLNGRALKSEEIVLYLWNNKLYKIEAELVDGSIYTIKDEELLKQALDNGYDRLADMQREQLIQEINAEMAQERLEKPERRAVNVIPTLYWGENIASINKKYSVRYKDDEDSYNSPYAMRYEIIVPEFSIDQKTVKDGRVILYMWHDQLYKIRAEFDDGTVQDYSDEKLISRVKVDRGHLRLYRRSIIEDINSDSFYIHWGENERELRALYYLQWGSVSPKLAQYTITLTDRYEQDAPYMLVYFYKAKLYKVQLHFDEDKNVQSEFYKKNLSDYTMLKQALTEKFGIPSYDEENNVLTWQDEAADESKFTLDNRLERLLLNKEYLHWSIRAMNSRAGL